MLIKALQVGHKAVLKGSRTAAPRAIDRYLLLGHTFYPIYHRMIGNQLRRPVVDRYV